MEDRRPASEAGRRRELRPTPATGGALVVVAVAWDTWHSSGSRFALFVCFAVLVAMVVDLAWAVTSTRKVRLRVEAVPTDLHVGDRDDLTLAVAGPALTFEVRVLPGQAPLRCRPPASGRLPQLAERRQVVTFLDVEVAGRGLAGLVLFARHRRIPLPHPLHVGPRPLAPPHPFPELFGAWGDGAPRPAVTGDVVRGVRGYVPGDPLRRIHWPATARRDELVVKEVEDPGAPRLVVALDLGGGGDAGERAAARAAWYADEALRRGYEVVLATVEAGGPVTAPVGPAHEVNRRLARATRGRPRPAETRPGHDPGQRVAVVSVTPLGDSWPS
ncbi:MAG: DUF58 domain-containing protein [Actinomycetota bacterium]|nr:DUF58 domain-containing protein [Actinomycetota bacterium]